MRVRDGGTGIGCPGPSPDGLRDPDVPSSQPSPGGEEAGFPPSRPGQRCHRRVGTAHLFSSQGRWWAPPTLRKTMKAILLERPGKFEKVSIDEPGRPGQGEALVRVHRVGICGTDISGYLGKMPFFSYPRIPGHELGVE